MGPWLGATALLTALVAEPRRELAALIASLSLLLAVSMESEYTDCADETASL